MIDKGGLLCELGRRTQERFVPIGDAFFDVLFVQHAESRGIVVDDGGRLGAAGARAACCVSLLW